jgi:site-specific DNA-methyltransferase (adenine-specific)
LIRNKYTEDQSFKALDISNEREKKHFNLYNNWATLTDISEDTWKILPGLAHSILSKIEKYGKPLHKWDIEINYGIKTGYNEAFVITTEIKDNILNECSSQKERELTEQIIKPLLRGRDIKRYSIDWQELWLINTHNGYTCENKTQIPPIDIEQYPTLKNYLENFHERLYARADQGETPYNLRNCSYVEHFFQNKIIYQELSQGSRFYFDTSRDYYVSNTGYIITGDHLGYLTGMLNSRAVEYAFKEFYCTKLGNTGIRWLHQNIINLPIPDPPTHVKNQVRDIVIDIQRLKALGKDTTQLEAQIDQIVYELYHLTDEEIAYIEETTKQ